MEIKIICNVCNGVGAIGEGDAQTCPKCSGEKFFTWGKFVLPDGVFWAYQVYESINKGEYDALSDSQQLRIRNALSLGMVVLNDGSHARNMLWSKFDSESTTRANLLTLIGE